MAPSPQHSARKLLHSRSLLLALLCVVGAACGTTAPTGKILFEDPRGTVSLQTISDQSIQASHPIKLEPALIARVLSGMYVQRYQWLLQDVKEGEKIRPVFSAEEVEFLAPQIAKALTTAAPGETVAFQVTSPHPGNGSHVYMDTTAGSLYVYDLFLYVTLSQYRYNPMLTNMVDSTSAAQTRQTDPSGLKNRILLFTPDAAQRDVNSDRPTGAAVTDRILAIDYQMLQRASQAVATTEQTAPQVERAAPVRESPAGTGASDASSQTTEALAREVETLRKELRSVQKQLGSQTTRQDSQNPKTIPSSKSQQTAP